MTTFSTSPEFPLMTPWPRDVADGPYRLRLTPRQLEVWGLLARGYSNVAIAADLGVGLKWIDHTVGALYAALGIDTLDRRMNARVQAAILYVRPGGPNPS